MEAGKRTISDIYNYNRVLEIPFFQRSYVWSEENWERFLDDMKLVSDENRDYFLGSVILKQQETPSDNSIGDVRVVVDGQQRLTTLIIFFKLLCQSQSREKDFERQFLNRNDEIILKHNHNDVAIFEAIVNDNLSADHIKNNEQSSILKCHQYFLKRSEDLQKINFDTLLNKIYFVGIDLSVDEDEQQIFDTINSLGVSLSTAELLKNELFRRKEDEELFNRTWRKTFEGDNRDYWSQEVTAGRHRRENIDLLLQTYLLLESDAKDKYTRTDSLFKNYKDYIKDNSINKTSEDRAKFIEGLTEYANLYKQNIDPRLTDEGISSDSNIERLNLILFGLNTTTIIPYIIFLLKEVSDITECEKMFKLLESYLMRRLACKETTKNYNNLFISFIRNKINTYAKLTQTIYEEENQSDIYPDNEALRKGFLESKITNQQAKTALYLIETAIRDNGKDSTKVHGLDHYSLEHIMPKKWRNHWDANLDEEAAKVRNEALMRLGNLTIITSSLNKSIRDASWEIKKSGNGKKLGLLEHGKGIKIFDRPEFLGAEVWDENTIQERALFLYKKALCVWPYEKQILSLTKAV